MGGGHLSPYAIQSSKVKLLPDVLGKQIVDFHTQYGLPYCLLEFGDRYGPYTTAIHAMMRQAQLINLTIEYRRVTISFTYSAGEIVTRPSL